MTELRDKSYQPQPVRRVEIPKPAGGTRLLGIPAVRDRVVQQALLDILQPIFDPGFHPSSYGYRPGRSCHHAITKATMFIRDYQRKWVVDMDLSKCFDTLDHDHRIIRYADDILILCQSKKAATNALTKASSYLEGELRLTVNREKTHITHSWKGVKFLGVSIHSTFTKIQAGKIKSFKEKVKAMTRRNVPVNLDKIIDDLNPLLVGFSLYYRIANCSSVLRNLSSWIRRRLRAIQLKLWKTPKRLHRRLRQLGYTGEFDSIRMSSWANAASPLASYAIPNDCLHKNHCLFDISAVKTGISVSL